MKYRIKRVNSLILREMTNILRNKVHDPRVSFVTVTGVATSADLRSAKIFIASTGDEQKDSVIISALDHARFFIQRKLSEAVFLKYLPELKFFIDTTDIKAERIEQIIETLHREDTCE